MEPITIHTLGRAERLKHRKLIDDLFKKGKSFVVPPYRLYYKNLGTPDAGKPSLQFGVGVSKRYFKKAADRNRIKRLTREAYRTQCHHLKSLVEMKNIRLVLFFIYTGKELPGQQQCREAIDQGLEKLSRTLSPNK
ncbi:ribonuclease P protein component [Flavihumibacter profundi]|uniref:ribonuclease P protein component n=1 Tax=Flavihumibacter profundi TaxID=2716883 RepID=UPI001CC79CD2|nr:ribonuclease P protein component [Flavihumibacter profundi]MBZ5857881.1 ribonuclease P protein component [Flavihumibacter profundi]